MNFTPSHVIRNIYVTEGPEARDRASALLKEQGLFVSAGEATVPPGWWEANKKAN